MALAREHLHLGGTQERRSSGDFCAECLTSIGLSVHIFVTHNKLWEIDGNCGVFTGKKPKSSAGHHVSYSLFTSMLLGCGESGWMICRKV